MKRIKCEYCSEMFDDTGAYLEHRHIKHGVTIANKQKYESHYRAASLTMEQYENQ